MSCCCRDQLGWSKDSALVRLLEWITSYCPRRNYGIWLYMNTSIVLWSLLLLAELCLTEDPESTRIRMEGTEAYLVYNFGAMLVWVLGAGLHLLDHIYVHQVVAQWNKQEGQEDQYCRPEELSLLNSCNWNKSNDGNDEKDPETDATNHDEQSASKTMQDSKTIDLLVVLCEFILSIYYLDSSRRAFRKWQTADKDVQDELINTIINIGAFSFQMVRIWKIRQEVVARELAEIEAEKAYDDDATELKEVHINTVYYTTWSVGNLHGLDFDDQEIDQGKEAAEEICT